MILYALACIAGILNGLMDDFRDRYPVHVRPLFRSWSWYDRTPSMRYQVKLYGKFFLTDRVIEWFNDPWHTYKFVMVVLLFYSGLEIERASDVISGIVIFGIAFELTYHKRIEKLWQKLKSRHRQSSSRN